MDKEGWRLDDTAKCSLNEVTNQEVMVEECCLMWSPHYSAVSKLNKNEGSIPL